MIHGTLVGTALVRGASNHFSSRPTFPGSVARRHGPPSRATTPAPLAPVINISHSVPVQNNAIRAVLANFRLRFMNRPPSRYAGYMRTLNPPVLTVECRMDEPNAGAKPDPRNPEPRPPAEDDLVALCRELNLRGARYVVLGGFAINNPTP